MRYNHFSMLPEQAFSPRSKVFAHGGMTREGGDGGGGQAQPTSTSTTTIPEYAKPYVERLLGKAEAASEAPYQTYGGERLTGPTQQQLAARQGVAGLQQPGQFGAGTELAAMGGLGALGFGGQAAQAGQNYMGLATSPGAQQAFMSPYMQNVVDVQKQEAIRDAQKGNLAGNLAAARQGTYGGARQLLAQTERERNLGSQLAQIQATGQQRAFEAAQQAQQFGSNLGLQGLGQAIGAGGQAAQAGATLGQLGIGQQQQDLARLQAQEQAGALGQREQQAALDLAYQDFLAQQRYPYSQLGFMSDILRGSGNLAGTGGQAIYQAPPSTGSQLLGLASSLGGAYLAGGGKFFQEGGEVRGLGAVKNYAEGGSVMQDMIDVEKLNADQIQQIRNTGARKDVPDIILLGELEAKLAEMKRMQAAASQPPQSTAVEDIRNEAMQAAAGLDAIPVPDDYYRDETELAGGGIIAFADGGVPSMDPGMPYGFGYTNNMGYAEGGRVGGVEYADGSVGYALPGVIAAGRAAMPFIGRGISALRSGLGGPDKAIIGGATGLARGVGNLAKGAVRNPLTTAATLGAGYGYVAGEGGEPSQGTAGAGDEKSHEADGNNAAKKAQPKVAVSDKTESKIKKAEDSYEQYLRKMLKDSEMAEADKNEAIGFALMKAGAKAMSGKSQYALQNIGEGIEAGADEYIRNLSQAKKDKKEAMKTLAEYGLAKEKLGIEREKALAAREGVAEQAATRREIAEANTRQKYFDAYQDAYKYIPQFKPDNTPNPQWKSFSKFMSEAQASRGPDTTSATPIGERQPLTSDRYR
jgi:hypothetical protein